MIWRSKALTIRHPDTPRHLELLCHVQKEIFITSVLNCVVHWHGHLSGLFNPRMGSNGAIPAPFLVDPAALHILLIDANTTSRDNITALLQKYNYQVTSCKTSQEAIRSLKLKTRQGPEGSSGFDLILKEHSPAQGTNACRLLRKAQTESALKGIPIIVVSTTEDRGVMVSCLQLGAADYMIKPLRHNEVRNLWARVYWWRRASYLQQQPAGSVPPGRIPSQPSIGTEETKGEEEDAQEDLEEDSGEGSAPNASGYIRPGSNDNGSKELESKNDSKEALGWSGNQPKPVSGGDLGARANGTCGVNQTCQGSNHPSNPFSDAAADPNGGGNSNTRLSPVGPRPPAVAEPVALRIAPLDLPAKPADSAKHPAASHLGKHEASRNSGDAPPGFRAYVSNEMTRKRSAENMDNAQMVTPRSSGSDHTQSMGDRKSRKRRASSSRMKSGSAEVAAFDATYNLPGDCTPAGDSQPGGPATAHGQSVSGSCAAMNQAASNGFKGYYNPFEMMTPFTVPPQFWSQMGGQMSAEMDAQMGDQEKRVDDSIMFPQFSQQVQNQHGSNNLSQGQQQQQMAMHNQLMYQHSMLMQQCGMPAPPFVSFQNLNRAMASQATQSHQANQPQQTGLQGSNPQPRRCNAPTPVNVRPPAPPIHGGQPGGSQRQTPSYEVGLRSNPNTWSAGPTREHSMPASGMLTGTGNGTSNGNTLGSAPGNATGATSHASAQLGMDGSLVDPSCKERRAQALHKYKQKRKNLNFTKKIRYESRKQLAQARPRVKGQFIRLQSREEEVSEPLIEIEEGSQMEPQTTTEKVEGKPEVSSEQGESK